MKIRQGFVSNSSSSSFICGIAEIKDKAKFNKYIEENKIKIDDYDTFIYKRGDDKWEIRSSKDSITVDSFLVSSSVPRSKSDGAEYFVVNISNDEGDGPFWNDNIYEMEYDIAYEIDYYSQEQQQIYKMFNDPNSGLSMVNDVKIGAARDG